jgi:hypothetical protein
MYIMQREAFYVTNFGELKEQFRHSEYPSSDICSILNRSKAEEGDFIVERGGRRYTFDFAHSLANGSICFKVKELTTSLVAEDSDNFLFQRKKG